MPVIRHPPIALSLRGLTRRRVALASAGHTYSSLPPIAAVGILAIKGRTLVVRALLNLLFVAVSMTFAARARAFSDPQAYAEPADVGGGAGRWFTGSSADGYSCEVCHTGEPGVDLTLTGLPIEGFAPGQSYEISLTWPVNAPHVALLAEFTDEQRRGAGALALPRPETLKPAELCSAEQGSLPASALHAADNERALVSVIDCGARTLRFQWTAPPSAAGPIWFNAGFVTSNTDATPAGDGVTLVRRPLPILGSTLPARVIAQGCASLPISNGSWLWFSPLLAALVWRRLRKLLEVTWER